MIQLGRSVVLLLVLLVLLVSLPARTLADEVDFSPLEAVVRHEQKATNVPGVVLVLVRGDRVIYAQGFGVASVETKERVTPDHLFRIGSTTKMFVGTALARLAAADKLKLEEPLGRHIDTLPPGLAALTPHQLLTHTAGLSDEAPMFGRHDDEALGDGIRKWQDERLFSRPGDIFSYSNPGYWLAGYMAERAAGKPFADVLADDLFGPLGMKRTTFRPTLALTWPLAQGHALQDGLPAVIRPAANNAATWPAGSLFTSGHDLARFVITFLNGGKLDGKQVLPEEVIKTIATPHVRLPGGGHYGYGLMIQSLRGVVTVSHGGARSGYGSRIVMVPEHKIGVILLANRTGAALPKTVAKATELLLPPGPEPKSAPAEARGADQLERLAGTYRNGATTIELRWRDNQLVQVNPGPERPVTGLGGMRFRTGSESFVAVTGQDGKTAYLFMGMHAFRKQESP